MNGKRFRRMQSCVLGVIVLCCLLLLVAACKVGPAIVGKWEGEDGSTMEFYKEGTVTMAGGLVPVTGGYTIVNNKTLRLDLGGLWGLVGPQMFEYRVSGKRLTGFGRTISRVRRSPGSPSRRRRTASYR